MKLFFSEISPKKSLDKLPISTFRSFYCRNINTNHQHLAGDLLFFAYSYTIELLGDITGSLSSESITDSYLIFISLIRFESNISFNG